MANPTRQLNNILWLAIRDYAHEWRMSGCFILALAAVLGPLLVLFGLKFGIVSSMLDGLVEDPRNRELRAVGSGHFGPDWFAALSAWPEVAFVVPRTRSLAATMDLYKPGAPRIIPVELISSAPGDPLLPEGTSVPQGLGSIVLSASAAKKLELAPGDQVDGSLTRRFRGKRERVHLDLTVAAVAPPGAFMREAAFVSLALLVAAEDFRDGRAVPEAGWDGDSATTEARSFPGYRLYARSIYEVASLEAQLAQQGLETRTNTADIQMVQSIDRNLSIIFWIIALVGLIGFSLSLGASLWANVDRKRRELSVLRLVGFETGGIVWFPVLQAVFTAFLGWLSASLIYLGVGQGINRMFASHLETGQTLCQLLPSHFGASLALTLCAAIISAALGGFRAARIEPSEGLREI